VDDAYGKIVREVGGLATCVGAGVVAVLLLRRWGEGGDVWWPDDR